MVDGKSKKAPSRGRRKADAEPSNAAEAALEGTVQGPPDPPARVARHVQPLGPRVLVRITERPDRLESGLYLPATAKDGKVDALLGEVLEVARTQPRTDMAELDHDDDDDEPNLGSNVSGIPLGATVLVPHDRGITIPWDDSLRLVEVRHVLAIVEEIPEDALQ